MTYDSINPNHYRGDRKFEPIEVIEDWGLNYRLGNAVKYISRNGRKPGEDPREGLKKAIWYLQREIESLEPDNVPYAVTYEDVLEEYAACAEAGVEKLNEYAISDADLVDWDDFWNDGMGWDPSLGPVEPLLTDEEVDDVLAKKDLDQFDEDEIVTIIERRDLLIGVKADGSTCVLGGNGKCQ